MSKEQYLAYENVIKCAKEALKDSNISKNTRIATECVKDLAERSLEEIIARDMYIATLETEIREKDTEIAKLGADLALIKMRK